MQLKNNKNFLVFNILKFFKIFFKKKDNVWIFGERNGKEYGNNSKYLFLHILKEHKDIIPIWFTKNKNVYNEVKHSGGKVYYINSLKAFYYGIIAKVYIHSHGRNDIVHYVKNNSFFINLYHSMALKSLPQVKSNDDLDIATSELTKKNRINTFNIKNTIITGEPRYDIFFKNIDKRSILNKYGLDKYYNKVIVSYLPTFRKYESQYVGLSFERDTIYGMDNVVIFEKSHPTINKDNFSFKKTLNQVVNISNLNVDSQELLAITDILITDYSGCFVDFLLTRKPIILYVYDLKKYIEKRGLNYTIKQLNAGKIVFNEQDLLESIKKYINNPELDKDKREKTKNLFHKYKDGKSSERVYKEIIKLIKKQK